MKIETNLLEKITKKAQEDNTNTNTINTVKNIWDNPLTKVAVGVVGVGALALVTRGAVRNNASKRVAGLREVLAKYQDDLARVKSEMEIPTNNRCYKRIWYFRPCSTEHKIHLPGSDTYPCSYRENSPDRPSAPDAFLRC